MRVENETCKSIYDDFGAMMSHRTRERERERERERGVVEARRRQRALGSIIPIQAKLKQGSRWIDCRQWLTKPVDYLVG